MKRYLGDGVYADDGYTGDALKLTTENGITTTNTIYLEIEVIVELIRYINEKFPGAIERITA